MLIYHSTRLSIQKNLLAKFVVKFGSQNIDYKSIKSRTQTKSKKRYLVINVIESMLYNMNVEHNFQLIINFIYIFNDRFSSEKTRLSHIHRIHQTAKAAKSEICEYCAKTFASRKEVGIS